MSGQSGTRSFDAAREELPAIRRFVADEAARLRFRGSIPDLQLAVTEACANAILHSRTRQVHVSVVPAGTCLEVTVEDDGVYRTTLPIPELDGQGHRGLQLMAAVVDRLTLRRGTDEQPGTVVWLEKCG